MIFVALSSAVAGLIVGFLAARIIAWNYGPGLAKELLGALGIVFVIAGISVLMCRLLADIPPTIDGRVLNLEVTRNSSKDQLSPIAAWRLTMRRMKLERIPPDSSQIDCSEQTGQSVLRAYDL